MLGAEPFVRMPWEAGRLSPFQVRRVLLAERDKKGQVLLDGPLAGPTAETDMAAEWRAELVRAGYTDPDAIRLAVPES